MHVNAAFCCDSCQLLQSRWHAVFLVGALHTPYVLAVTAAFCCLSCQLLQSPWPWLAHRPHLMLSQHASHGCIELSHHSLLESVQLSHLPWLSCKH